MKFFKTANIKQLDRYTIENEPISSIDLMERAAMKLRETIVSLFPEKKSIYIFAGQGNNGGDALALARLLIEEGYEVYTYLCNPTKKLSLDCKKNKERLLEIADIHFTEIVNEFIPPVLKEEDVVIDGLFGSGLNKALEGGFAALVRYINSSPAQVISIDIPSGLFGEKNITSNIEQIIIKADITLTFQFPKLAFLFSENEKYTGDVKVLDIGIHPEAIKKTPTDLFLLQKNEVKGIIKKREKFSHKGNYGHGLLFSGSFGKMGAAVLSATAAMRSGIGLLTAHVPECGKTILQTAIPEAMLNVDSFYENIATLPDLTHYSAFGVGPGIGTSAHTSTFLESLLSSVKNKPVILDADALNIISTWPIIGNAFPKNCIITPHPKEFDRLAGNSENSYQRFIKAQSFAKKYQIYVVLKGAYTAILCPTGEAYFNTTGNPGMATAGSGDVLTGILLSLVCQGYTLKEAAILGVYLHGLAGDIAAAEISQESMIARDIIGHLGKAFCELKK
ncbi:MAG: NAD(P)H-hydrate dehydratase [Candidatus Azobacteroides sp.]|nr:NAD(P)H-hydrate dehydratase [Candidatus Azobacteroides sp.]